MSKSDNGSSHTVVPEGVYEGQPIQAGGGASVEIGNLLPLAKVPAGTMVCNVELSPGDGGKLARSSKTLYIGYVLSRKYAQRLRDCPYLRKVSFKSDQWVFSPQLHRLWNQCTLDGEHCNFHGRRLKFDTHCKIGTLRVVWACPKIVDLPFLRGENPSGRLTREVVGV